MHATDYTHAVMKEKMYMLVHVMGLKFWLAVHMYEYIHTKSAFSFYILFL